LVAVMLMFFNPLSGVLVVKCYGVLLHAPMAFPAIAAATEYYPGVDHFATRTLV
jgi:hypothetical protein